MLDKPLVSCIITCYNQEAFIKKALESVINQTYKNLEIIIVDDFSKDKSKQIIESFNDERINTICHKKNSGLPAKTRNTGIKAAKGKLIAFLDADDLWKPNKLEIQLKYIKNPDISGVGCQSELIGIVEGHRKDELLEKELLLDTFNLLSFRTVPLSSLLIKNKHLLFNEDRKFLYCEDKEFQIRLSYESKKPILLLNKRLIKYRIHPDGGSYDARKTENILNINKEYDEILGEKLKKTLDARHYFGLGLKALRNNDPKSRYYYYHAFIKANFKLKCFAIIYILLSFMPKKIKNYFINFYYNSDFKFGANHQLIRKMKALNQYEKFSKLLF